MMQNYLHMEPDEILINQYSLLNKPIFCGEDDGFNGIISP